jgi:centractin
VHQIVVDAINRTDLDLRKSLYSNIVLSGGSTLTKGFGDRLLTELQRLAVKDMRIKIFAPPERKYSTWIGGSILAGLSTFRKVSLIGVLGVMFPRLTSADVGEHRRLAREPRHYPHQVHVEGHATAAAALGKPCCGRTGDEFGPRAVCLPTERPCAARSRRVDVFMGWPAGQRVREAASSQLK